jgi:hypothetical protein
MSLIRYAAAVVCFFLMTATGAQDKKPENKLPDPVLKALEKATALEVYSINGEKRDKDGWHGWKLLGQKTVKKAADRRAVAAALKKGIEDGKNGARCFIPRHGVRATHEGTTYDLVICFECNWVYIYTDASDKPTVLVTTDAAEKVLNKLLTDAKVPLAKPANVKENDRP